MAKTLAAQKRCHRHHHYHRLVWSSFPRVAFFCPLISNLPNQALSRRQKKDAGASGLRFAFLGLLMTKRRRVCRKIVLPLFSLT